MADTEQNENWSRLMDLVSPDLTSTSLLIGSGSSCALGLPGIKSLSERLLTSDWLEQLKVADPITAAEISSGLRKEPNIERALQDVVLNKDELRRLKRTIWNEISASEMTALTNYQSEIRAFGQAIKRIDSEVYLQSIITTNYDRIIEIACSSVGLNTFNGVVGAYGGAIRLDRLAPTRTNMDVIDILKIHGSLDWHVVDEALISTYPSNPSLSSPDTPGIVIPGANKFQDILISQKFRLLQTLYSIAMSKVTFLVTYGFGYSDDHLNSDIEAALARNCKVLCITRDMTPNMIGYFLPRGRGFFALTKPENASGSTLLSSDGVQARFEENLWSMPILLE